MTSTQLDDRELRFDGVSHISPELVSKFFLLGAQPHQLRVTSIDSEVELFNANVDGEELRLNDPTEVKLDFAWNLPERYLNLDLDEWVATCFETRCPRYYTVHQHDQAIQRLADELAEIKQRDMTRLIQTIAYVLDVFKEKGVVWGVGRGSSCACYVLFVMGLHSVDCIRYGIPMSEFFHE